MQLRDELGNNRSFECFANNCRYRSQLVAALRPDVHVVGNLFIRGHAETVGAAPPVVIRNCTARVCRGHIVSAWHAGSSSSGKAEKGWGAISSDELPPGRDAWAHYSHIMDMPGYRALEAGQAVELTFMAAKQDSFDFSVIEVRLVSA